MVEVATTATTIEPELNNTLSNKLMSEYIVEILANYKTEFRDYFYRECKEVIEYFGRCPEGMVIYQWLFSELNLKKLPLSAKEVIKNVKGLSRINGLSFIRQFKLADRLECSDRWIRNIVSRLKQIALVFSVKTNKIHYCVTFDLSKGVTDYIDLLVAILFDHHSKSNTNNSASATTPITLTTTNPIDNDSNSSNDITDNITDNEEDSEPASRSNSEPTSGSMRKFSLANLVYTTLSSPFAKPESLKIFENRDKEKSEEGRLAGRLASTQSQPASPSTGINFSDGEKEEITTNSDLAKEHYDNASNKEIPKSIHSYELCKKFTLEYAKFKLGTSDEIRTLEGFATYCYNSGEKDFEIELFVENNYVYTQYNPLKNKDIKQTTSEHHKQGSQQPHQQNSSDSMANGDGQPYSSAFEPNKQANTFKEKQNSDSQEKNRVEIENQGKYNYETYLDYVECVERPRLERIGRIVKSAKALAGYMLITGDDDKKVGSFLELMRVASIGARPGDFRNNNPIAPTTIPTETTQPTSAKQPLPATFKEEFEQQVKFENLKDELWQNLPTSEQQSLLVEQIKELKASKHFHSTYRSWSETILRDYATNQVKKQLANKSNIAQNNRLIANSGLYFS